MLTYILRYYKPNKQISPPDQFLITVLNCKCTPQITNSYIKNLTNIHIQNIDIYDVYHHHLHSYYIDELRIVINLFHSYSYHLQS